MKTVSVAVAAAVVLTFICVRGNSAFPLAAEQEEAASYENTAEETSVETWMMPFDIRQQGHTDPIRCSYCCGCCVPGVCGVCCG